MSESSNTDTDIDIPKDQRSIREWVSSLPAIFILVMVLLFGSAEMLAAQMLKMGEHLFENYFILRADIPTPECNPNPDLDAEIAKLRAESESKSKGGGDDLDALFDNTGFDEGAARQSLEATRELCREKHRIAQENQSRVTPAVKVYRGIETFLAGINQFGIQQSRMLLLMLLLICSLTATFTHHHISIRPIRTKLDHLVAGVAQTIANFVLTTSAYIYYQNQLNAGTQIQHSEVLQLLIMGFAVMTMSTIWQLFHIPANAPKSKNIGIALLTVPLYCYMAFAGANWFFFREFNAAGIANYFTTLFELPTQFLQVALYIWVGVLLKQSRIVQLVFDLFKSWRLPPELMAFVAVLIMSMPTAYTGASGVIVIALAPLVYQEMRRVGTRRQLAFATTAMSGSLGVVLHPCLLVVIIAALNKEVTTDAIFTWGNHVFTFTALLFFVVCLFNKTEKLKIAPFKDALQPTLATGKHLIPYILVLLAVVLGYRFLLNSKLDEFSAPIILPVVLLAVLYYEKRFAKTPEGYENEDRPKEFGLSLRVATTDTTVHIGALILLMGVSLVVAGVIERAELIKLVPPEVFGTTFSTMCVILVLLVIIGTTMDPYGAILLVSGSIAQAAYQHGINPIHFWIVVLTAFELGYLSPPVMLNHVLARQAIGFDELRLAIEDSKHLNFWRRHEMILLPMTVMFIALLCIAFVPLFFYAK
ncbi:MAG TPA: TRAP transporter large permease subunit [Pseudomonadales bacterium]|nr:TRAP transporter large permease subunit [Pseudomonadales bacterium]